MEHSVDLSAKTFVQAVSPSSARKLLKKTKGDVGDDNPSAHNLENFDFEDGDDGEEDEGLEAELSAADSVGKALLLVKQVRQSWLGQCLWTFT